MQAISLGTSELSQTTASTRRSAPLSPEVADRLLNLLSTDDVFRKLMTRDPHEALRRVGFVNTTDLPSPADCEWGIKLASKETIAVAHGEIRSMLTAGLAQTAPQLDASLVHGCVLRR